MDADSEYIPYDLYIHEANDADKTLKIKFPGAPSGDYMIKLQHANQGRIDSNALIVTTEAIVTSMSKNQGSNLGGTLITITGINFSDDKYDNPVQADGYDCFVLETSPTEITCRVGET